MTAHAKLSPSSASSWMTCPDYPNAVDGLPDDESKFSVEGTIAHEVSDNCLTMDMDPFDFIGMTTTHPTKGWTFEWTEDDAEYLQPGIDWIREQPGTFYGEHRVDLSPWLGLNQFGTLDRGIVHESMVTISDLKFGRGLPVSPVNNKQLRLYALGFVSKFAPHITDRNFPVRIVIDQPRNHNGGGTWMTTLGDLLDFGEEARRAAEATRQPNPPRVASVDACYWCKRRQQPPSEPGAVSGCKTYDEFNLALIQSEFDDLDAEELVLPAQDGLTVARQAFLHQHKDMIAKWLDGITASLMATASITGNAGGLKVVNGPEGRRKWTDAKLAEAAVSGLLGEKGFTKKLITPTQCGKAISKEDYGRLIAPLVVRGDPKPILVPLEDERQPLLLANEFDDFSTD